MSINFSDVWEPAIGSTDRKRLLEDFKMKYLGRYSGKSRISLSLNLENGVGSYWNPMDLFQIYSYLGIFKDEDNMYYGYYKKLAEHFDINCSVLDVACGAVPAFGLIISGKQLELPNSGGTVTVCDPALVLDTGKKDNMTLIRNQFDKEKVVNYDLITGVMPCSVTRDIIDSSCEYNKDFFIGLCGCPSENDLFNDGKSSIEHDIEYAYDVCAKYGRTLEVDHLDFLPTKNKPIIYSKKK